MLQALRGRVNEDEQGFTLIELLVVVIIIGILAAIAIPVFLNQRQRAWRSAVQSDLRNAAVQMETSYTDTGTYPDAASDAAGGTATMGTETMPLSDGVTITGGPKANPQHYCLEGTHANLEEDGTGGYTYDTEEGGLSAYNASAAGACTATP